MQKALQQAWYSTQRWIWCLAPLTALFYVLSACRRYLFKMQILPSYRANIPIIIVGNIGVGGNGKTPLVIALSEALIKQGLSIAILSRGYGGQQQNFPYRVSEHDLAARVGDEPLLLKKRVNCDLVIDPKRVRGAQFIEQHTNADIIICDDGMQHYALQRDCELCVIDHRKLGNGYLLPMGPLREGKWRLNHVSAIVNNFGFKKSDQPIDNNPLIKSDKLHPFVELESEILQAKMHLYPDMWINVQNGKKKSLKDFVSYLDETREKSKQVIALAGIGEPQRFFSSLDSLDINIDDCLSFVDHHDYSHGDIPHNAIVLMTEKDAVKCTSLAHEHCWYLQISATIDRDIVDVVNQSIKAFQKPR